TSRFGRLPVPYQFHLRLEPDTAFFLDLFARDLDERADLLGPRIAEIHDEVGMPVGERGLSHAHPLEPRAFEQTAREVSGRILEDRAGIGHSMPLARGPLRVKLGH